MASPESFRLFEGFPVIFKGRQTSSSGAMNSVPAQAAACEEFPNMGSDTNAHRAAPACSRYAIPSMGVNTSVQDRLPRPRQHVPNGRAQSMPYRRWSRLRQNHLTLMMLSTTFRSPSQKSWKMSWKLLRLTLLKLGAQVAWTRPKMHIVESGSVAHLKNANPRQCAGCQWTG